MTLATPKLEDVLYEAITKLTDPEGSQSGPQGGVSSTYYKAVQAGFVGHMGQWKEKVLAELERLAS